MDLVSKVLAYSQDAVKVNIFTTADSSTALGTLLTKTTNWVAIIAGIIAFFFLVFSGFTYLTAGGNAESAKKGLQGILNAVIGLVIIALAWLLVSAVAGVLATNPS